MGEEAQEAQELTYGQQYVGLEFNPSGSTWVEKLKQSAADQIDLLHKIETTSRSPEQADLCKFAQQQVLLGQMAAVKAATKGL